MEEEKYYGIYFNEKIPKIDKVNTFSKQVKIKFEGIAYLIKKSTDKEEKIELHSGHVIDKEGEYKIELINLQNQKYCLNLKIKSSLIIILFLLGILIFFIFLSLCISNNLPLSHFFSQIDISVIPIEINKKNNDISILSNSKKENKKVEKNINFESEIIPKDNILSLDEKIEQYDFEVEFNKTILISNISLLPKFSSSANIENKICPGVNGSFIIKMSTRKSTVDMNYKINFQDISGKKPKNLKFKIRDSDNEYSGLQDLENELIGRIDKNSIKVIIIDWFWPYESEDDATDTYDGIRIKNYKFNILVTGEEVV